MAKEIVKIEGVGEKAKWWQNSGLWAAVATGLGTGAAAIWGLDVDVVTQTIGSILGGVLSIASIAIAHKSGKHG